MTSDFSLCPGTGCQKKEQCFRYTAIKCNEYQWWMEPQACIDDDYSMFYPLFTDNLPEN